MTQRCLTIPFIVLAGASASACQYDHDTVMPGYYAQDGAKAMTEAPQMVSTQQQTIGATQSHATTGSSAAGQSETATANTSSAATATPAASGMTQSGEQAGMSGQIGVGSATNGAAGAMAAATAAAGAAANSGTPTQGTPSGSPNVPAGECDLSGRWLVTSHLTTDALGALQYAHYFEYFEIEQQGDAFTVSKGFMCGTNAVGDGSLAADVDFSGANAVLPSKVRYDGRTGTSTKTADGCQVELENWYTVRGVTTPYYLDPSHPLPTGDQPATDGSPGWEDWDNDGNPGITGVLSGIVSGKIFVGPRVWTEMSGAVTDTSNFRLAVKWGQEQNVLGYDGSSLLATEAAIGPDAQTHFAQFARLADDQATGDDLSICNAVIQLAPQLTPEATGS